MKLVNRVSMFFLAALAAVLLIYSAVFYFFVRSRLTWQFEQEMYSALSSLVAAAEIEPEEVKWQPLEHTIGLGAFQGREGVQWMVIGDRVHVVEQSPGMSPELLARAMPILSDTTPDDAAVVEAEDDDWRFLYQRLVAPNPDRSERESDEFDEIVVLVAQSAAPLHANLHRLQVLVCAVPLGTWFVAAAAGRWFCRKALRPVSEMAQQARLMTGAQLHARLPVNRTADELADLAMAFNTVLDRQHRAFEQQRRFAGDAAHELRTPLTVLLGHIDVGLRRLRTPEEYSEILRLLREHTAQLQKIVTSLLFLARADEDTSLPDSETIWLDEWLSDYVKRWADHPRHDDIVLHASESHACAVTASTALLARLMDNLVENALKYSPPGSRVDIELSKAENEALIAVQDHGRGIPAEDQSAIFAPFYRSRAAREAGIAGTGLGLAIAARIAEVSGGQIACTSVPEQGSRFVVRLPLANPATIRRDTSAGEWLVRR